MVTAFSLGEISFGILNGSFYGFAARRDVWWLTGAHGWEKNEKGEDTPPFQERRQAFHVQAPYQATRTELPPWAPKMASVPVKALQVMSVAATAKRLLRIILRLPNCTPPYCGVQEEI